MKVKKDESRKRTPWDHFSTKTELQEFIIHKYVSTYDFKHPKILAANEASFVNLVPVKKCLVCSSEKIKKYGFTKNGIQRYYCKDHKGTFTVFTGTIFEDHKVSLSEWIEYLLDIFRHQSFANTSKNNKNAYSTAKYWFKKLMIILEDYQNGIILKGKIYIDELYFVVEKSDIKRKEDGTVYKGLSRNQMCISIAFDGTNMVAIYQGKGKPNQKRMRKALKSHIEPGSHIIHDKEKSHKVLIKELNLTDEKYDSKELKKLDDKDNPLDPINERCRLLRRFLKAHDGFNRNELQGYLDVFCFIMNPPSSMLEKVENVLIRALRCPKILRYRDYYAKND